jgi:hypothetical protein
LLRITFSACTSDTSEDVQKCQGNSPEEGEIPPGKIVDFFAAREAMRSDARSAAKQAEFHQQIRAAARDNRRIHLFDPWEDVALLLLLVAAIILGLLIISGFG